jgi:hypothetical protein
MLDWERRALALGPSDTPHVIRKLGTTFDPGRDSTGSAWWVTAFFGPAVWKRWGVGLLHGSLNLWLTHPDERCDVQGVTADLPESARHSLGEGSELAARWQRVIITPVLVSSEALGFVIRGAQSPSQLVEVFAPTHLKTRLGIAGNQKTPIEVNVLPCDF